MLFASLNEQQNILTETVYMPRYLTVSDQVSSFLYDVIMLAHLTLNLGLKRTQEDFLMLIDMFNE